MSPVFQYANDNNWALNKIEIHDEVIPVNMPTPNTKTINFIENVTPYIQ